MLLMSSSQDAQVRARIQLQSIIMMMSVAGGLGTFLHADFVQTLVPSTAKYRAFADAG